MRAPPPPSPKRPAPPSLTDTAALDRIAAAMGKGLPDGLRAATEPLEEVQRLVRYTGRDAGRQFDEPTETVTRHG